VSVTAAGVWLVVVVVVVAEALDSDASIHLIIAMVLYIETGEEINGKYYYYYSYRCRK
jgi:hypothetical protein